MCRCSGLVQRTAPVPCHAFSQCYLRCSLRAGVKSWALCAQIKLKVEKTKTDREAELKRKHLLAVLNASYD